jgi:hypothetical protein
MSDWTAIIGDTTSGASMPGNYDVFASETAHPMF